MVMLFSNTHKCTVSFVFQEVGEEWTPDRQARMKMEVKTSTAKIVTVIKTQSPDASPVRIMWALWFWINWRRLTHFYWKKKDLLRILLNSKIQFLIFFSFYLSSSQKLCVCVSRYVCVLFVHVCGGSHVYGGTCACMWRPEVGTWCQPYFCNSGSCTVWDTDQFREAGLLAVKFPRYPNPGFTDMYSHSWLLTWVLWEQSQVLMHVEQAFLTFEWSLLAQAISF